MPAPASSSKSVSSFDPMSVTGCKLWIDAADASSVTTSSSTVTAIRDKSPNATVLTSPAGFTWPNNTFNGSYPSFYNTNTTGGRLGYNSSLSLGSQVTVFIVGHLTSPSAGNVFFDFIDGYTSSAGSSRFFLFASPQNNTSYFYALGSGGSGQVSLTNTSMGSPFIWTITCDTSTSSSLSTQYVNGTILGSATNGVAISSYTGITVGQRYTQSSESVVGHIGEMLIYNNALSTSQRQSIEGYLAKKWGITLVDFSPLSIQASCSLWLDASDTTTYTVSSGLLNSAWTDKSGTGNHAILASGTATATYPAYSNIMGIPAFNFASNTGAGTTGLMKTTNNVPAANIAFFMVAMFTGAPGAASGGYAQLFMDNYAGQRQCFVNSSAVFPCYVFFEANSSYYYYQQSLSVTNSNIPFLIEAVFGATGSSTNYVYGNGNASVGNPQNTNSAGASQWFIGGGNGGGQPFNGCIGELIMYSNSQNLTTAMRQQIESYLMQKWGISGTGALCPANTSFSVVNAAQTFTQLTYLSPNPFKTIKSFLKQFLPTDLPNCVLWLDGADVSSMTLSGSTVSQWNDKSGNGYNMTQVTSSQYPTLGTSTNGNRMLTFTQGSSTVLSNAIFGTCMGSRVATYFLVEYNMTASSGNPGPFGYVSSGAGNNYGIVMQYNTGFTGGLQPFQSVISSFTSSTPRIDYLYAQSNGTNMVGFVNGTSATVSATTYGGYSGAFYVGYATNGYISGNICELLVYNVALSESQRQQVEGYLAWKWGVRSSLPSTHSFYKFPSATPVPSINFYESFENYSVTLSSGYQYAPTWNNWNWRDGAGNVGGGGISGAGSSPWDTTPATAASGNYYAFIQGHAAYISHAITAIPGYKATVSFSYSYRNGTGRNAIFSLYVYAGGTLVGNFPVTTTGWTAVSCIYTMTSSSSNIQFYVYDPSGGDHSILVDNISVL